MRSHSSRMRQAISRACPRVRTELSCFRSPPETNALSPAPRMTSTRASRDASTSSRACSSWSIVSGAMALRACGRSIVTIARPSSHSHSIMYFSKFDTGILSERK